MPDNLPATTRLLPPKEMFIKSFIKHNGDLNAVYEDFPHHAKTSVWRAYTKFAAGEYNIGNAELNEMLRHAISEAVPYFADAMRNGDIKAAELMAKLYNITGEAEISVMRLESEGRAQARFVLLKDDWRQAPDGELVHMPTLRFAERRMAMAGGQKKHLLCANGCALMDAGDQALGAPPDTGEEKPALPQPPSSIYRKKPEDPPSDPGDM